MQSTFSLDTSLPQVLTLGLMLSESEEQKDLLGQSELSLVNHPDHYLNAKASLISPRDSPSDSPRLGYYVQQPEINPNCIFQLPFEESYQLHPEKDHHIFKNHHFPDSPGQNEQEEFLMSNPQSSNQCDFESHKLQETDAMFKQRPKGRRGKKSWSKNGKKSGKGNRKFNDTSRIRTETQQDLFYVNKVPYSQLSQPSPPFLCNRSQRARKPSQKVLDSIELHKLSQSEVTIQKGSKRVATSVGRNIGSRSTSEMSSYLSQKEVGSSSFSHSLEKVRDQSQSVIQSSRGRNVKNPIHQDYITYARPQNPYLSNSNNLNSIYHKNPYQHKSITKKQVNPVETSTFKLGYLTKNGGQKIKKRKVLKINKMIMRRKMQQRKVAPIFDSDTKIKIPITIQSPIKVNKQEEHYQLSSIEKKKPSASFSIEDVIVSSELTSKIDTTKWINQANIVTPDFKRSQHLKQFHSEAKPDTSDLQLPEDLQPRSTAKLQSGLSLDNSEKVSCKRNLNSKFEQNLYEEVYIVHHFEEGEVEGKQVKVIFGIKKITPTLEVQIHPEKEDPEESEEELDDEVFMQRHWKMEQEEIQRYNVGLKGQSNSNNYKKKPKEVEMIESAVSSQSYYALGTLVPIDPIVQIPDVVTQEVEEQKHQSTKVTITIKDLEKYMDQKESEQKLNRDSFTLLKKRKQKKPESYLRERENKRQKVQLAPARKYNLRGSVSKLRNDDFIYENSGSSDQRKVSKGKRTKTGNSQF